MLILFAFSVTPKIILHNLVANHKDVPLKSNFGNTAKLNVAGFNCSCDNLVVESPFVNNHIAPEIIIPLLFSLPINKEVNDLISIDQFYAAPRGPPCLV